MEDTTRGRFEVVVAESVDRLSRQPSAVGGLVDHLDFHRVKLYAVNTCEVTAAAALVPERAWRGEIRT